MKIERSFDDYDTLVAFDTETTGLDAKSDRVIELSAVVLTKTSSGFFAPKANYDSFIKQSAPLTEDIVRLTKITDDLLASEGEEESEVADDVRVGLTSLGRVLFVGYNAQFDICFIREMLRRWYPDLKADGENLDFIDAMTMYKDLFAYDTQKSEDGRPLGHRLDAAVDKLDIPVKNTHRSIDDAKATLGVFRSMCARVRGLTLQTECKPEEAELPMFIDAAVWADDVDKVREALPKGCMRKKPDSAIYSIEAADADALRKVLSIRELKVEKAYHKIHANPLWYVNHFGFSAKYGLNTEPIPGIRYVGQKGFLGKEVWHAICTEYLEEAEARKGNR